MVKIVKVEISQTLVCHYGLFSSFFKLLCKIVKKKSIVGSACSGTLHRFHPLTSASMCRLNTYTKSCLLREALIPDLGDRLHWQMCPIDQDI